MNLIAFYTLTRRTATWFEPELCYIYDFEVISVIETDETTTDDNLKSIANKILGNTVEWSGNFVRFEASKERNGNQVLFRLERTPISYAGQKTWDERKRVSDD